MPVIDMSEFGFAESEEVDFPADTIIDILTENPEIQNRLDPNGEFLPDKSANCT